MGLIEYCSAQWRRCCEKASPRKRVGFCGESPVFRSPDAACVVSAPRLGCRNQGGPAGVHAKVSRGPAERHITPWLMHGSKVKLCLLKPVVTLLLLGAQIRERPLGVAAAPHNDG